MARKEFSPIVFIFIFIICCFIPILLALFAFGIIVYGIAVLYKIAKEMEI